MSEFSAIKTFLSSAEDEKIQNFLRQINLGDIAIAWDNFFDENCKTAILNNLTERTQKMLLQEVASRGDVSVEELKDALNELCRHALTN